MKTDLVVADGPGQFSPARYNAMRRAIAECVTIDDCLKAQSIAAAMATYYHQIKDTTARRQLDEIRLRAWRQMAAIIAKVDVSKCQTQRAMVETVRKKLGAAATEMLSDSRIIQLIRLAGVPDHSFEDALEKCGNSIDRMLQEAHPDSVRKRKENEEFKRKYEADAGRRAEQERSYVESQQRRAEKEAELRADAVIDLVKQSAIAEAPFGLTLTPKIKNNLVTFSVMMDRKMHDQLRDAAHERRTTMWAILRESANYWFVVNGYDKV